jgi:hypothetical protein
MGVYYGKADFVNYGKPSLFLDFANKKSLVDRISGKNLITFSRNSIGTYVGSDGLIKTASANEARFDHDPLTGESLGLLVEESRSNIGWIITDNSSDSIDTNVLSPTGSYNAYLRQANESFVTNQSLYVYPGWNSISIFVKPGASSVKVGLQVDILTQNAHFFDFTTKTFTAAGWSYEEYPNNWYRLKYSQYRTDYIGGHTLRLQFLDAQSQFTTGYYWGWQHESGASFPTSYIPTTSSTVTRSADNASITGSNFSRWFNNTEGSLYSELFFNDTERSDFVDFPLIANNTGSAYIGGYYYGVDGISYFEYVNTNANYVEVGSATIAPNTNFKNIIAYKNGDFGAAVDGSIIGTSSSSITFATDLNTLLLGRWINENSHINGCIKSCSYYPTRLTNAQLQGITR